MRCSIAILALVGAASASLVARQDIPACATPCLTGADISGCSSIADTPCLCKSEKFVASTTACIQKECQGDQLAAAESVARGLCEAVGVTLTAPTATGGSTTAAPSSTGASASSAVSSVASSLTSVASASKSAASSAASAAASNAASSNSVNVIAGAAVLGLAALF